MGKTLFLAEQFTATKWDNAEEKAKWANAMASWVKQGFPEKGWRRGLYEPLHTHMYGHIAHYNRQRFYEEWFRDIYHRLDWLNYVASGGALGSAGSPAWTWSDVENVFSIWVTSSGLIAQYGKLCDDETEMRERALLARLQEKYPTVSAMSGVSSS